MLAPDHGLDIVPENDLGIGVVFRLHHIDGLVLVDGAEARFGQLVRHAGTQHRGTVQAQHRIHRRIVHKMGHQLVGAFLGLAEPGLLIGDVDVIVDVGVVGCEMPTGDPQRDVAPAHGKVYQFDHNETSNYTFAKKKSVFNPGTSVFAGS